MATGAGSRSASEARDPNVDHDVRPLPDRRRRDQAGPSRHPEIREGWPECPGTVCSPRPVRQDVRRALRRLSIRNRMDRARSRCSGHSRPPRTFCGFPASPVSPDGKASSMAPSSSTPMPGASSAGRRHLTPYRVRSRYPRTGGPSKAPAKGMGRVLPGGARGRLNPCAGAEGRGAGTAMPAARSAPEPRQCRPLDRHRTAGPPSPETGPDRRRTACPAASRSTRR